MYIFIHLLTYIYIEFFKNGAEPGTGTISDSDLAAFNVIFHNLKKCFFLIIIWHWIVVTYMNRLERKAVHT